MDPTHKLVLIWLPVMLLIAGLIWYRLRHRARGMSIDSQRPDERPHILQFDVICVNHARSA